MHDRPATGTMAADSQRSLLTSRAARRRERDRARRYRASLCPQVRDRAERALVERLRSSGLARGIVGVYSPTDGEADAPGIVERAAPHVQLVFPRCVSGRRLEFAPGPAGQDGWRVGPHGIREPNAPAIDPPSIDLLIVPAVAVDRDGNRLGFGAGYYDRFLAAYPRLRERSLALVFDGQLLDQLPTLAHDQRLAHVITPAVWLTTELSSTVEI